MTANSKHILIGSGTGAIIAAALTAAKKKQRKNYIRNIILGALVGAAGGATVNPVGDVIQKNIDKRIRRKEELAEQTRKDENRRQAQVRNFEINNDYSNPKSAVRRLNDTREARNRARNIRNPWTAHETYEKLPGFLPEYKGLDISRMSPIFTNYFVDKMIEEELKASGLEETMKQQANRRLHINDGYLDAKQRDDERDGIRNSTFTAKDNVSKRILID